MSNHKVQAHVKCINCHEPTYTEYRTFIDDGYVCSRECLLSYRQTLRQEERYGIKPGQCFKDEVSLY